MTKPEKPVRTIWVRVNGWGIHGAFDIPEKHTMPLIRWLMKRAVKVQSGNKS